MAEKLKGRILPRTSAGGLRSSLTRRDILKRVQEKIADLHIPDRLVKQVIKAVIDSYKDAILESKRVEIRRFATIKAELIKGKIVLHPETRQPVVVAPHYRMIFIPARNLREKLRELAKEEAKFK